MFLGCDDIITIMLAEKMGPYLPEELSFKYLASLTQIRKDYAIFVI